MLPTGPPDEGAAYGSLEFDEILDEDVRVNFHPRVLVSFHIQRGVQRTGIEDEAGRGESRTSHDCLGYNVNRLLVYLVGPI